MEKARLRCLLMSARSAGCRPLDKTDRASAFSPHDTRAASSVCSLSD